MQKNRQRIIAALATAALVSPGWAIPDEGGAEGESPEPSGPTHMPESLRASLKKVVVLPMASPGGRGITGSYEKKTSGLAGGMQKGAEIGKGVGTDVGGIPVRIPFPILTLPGALIGGASGLTKREIQNFRDRLTSDLAEASSQPLSNDALASDVFWGIRDIPGIQSKVLSPKVPVPEDTDAVLYVSVGSVTIDVQGKDAVITTSATAELRRMSDGAHVYTKEVTYQDRDTLSNWTRNDNSLWRDYANFARHYIGREIAAEAFARIELEHELKPARTRSVKPVKKNDWHGVSKTSSPTLAWELALPGDASYADLPETIDTSNVYFDVEIYDRHRPVYSEKGVQGTEHTVLEELERCKSYRWSVRPSYRLGDVTRYGEWMRFDMETDTGRGSIGIRASDAPA